MNRFYQKFALAAVLAAPPLHAQIAYRETFPEHRNPAQYIRIAAAGEKWEILKDDDGARFMRVTMLPLENRPRALVVWDLAPLQFNRLSVRVRVNGSGAAPVFLSLSASDRFGSSYTFKPFGKADGAPRKPLPAGGAWATYSARTPDDLASIFERGKEVSPYVHGRGEAVTTWENVDFKNIGFKTLHFQIDVLKNSVLMGKPFSVDFKLLELANDRPAPPAAPLPH
jgi:hypothetical protein